MFGYRGFHEMIILQGDFGGPTAIYNLIGEI